MSALCMLTVPVLIFLLCCTQSLLFGVVVLAAGLSLAAVLELIGMCLEKSNA